MREEFAGIDLVRFVRALRRRFVVVLLCVLAAGGAAFALSEHQRKMYTASVSVLFQDPEINQQAAGVQVIADPNPQLLTATQIELASLVSVAQGTAATVGHGVTGTAVRGAISVSEQGQTNVGTFSATYSSPVLAAAIANTFARQFIAARRAEDQGNVAAALAVVKRQIAAMTPAQAASSTQGQSLVQRAAALQVLLTLQTGGAQIVSNARVPSSPSSPKVLRNTVIGLALGLLLGLLLVLLLERFDRTLKDVEVMEEEFGVPLLGAVPASSVYTGGLRLGDRGQAKPLAHGEAEAFRMLRAHLRYYNVDREMRTLVVTSAVSGDGKTTVACYLAEAAASMGTKVLLIEADLRRPSVAETFGIKSAPGLSDALISMTDCAHAVQSIPTGFRGDGMSIRSGGPEEGTLDVLTAGPIPPNPAELIESHAMEQALAWASFNYELVIIDTPPLLVVADAIPLLKMVSGIVIVARVGKSTRDQAHRMKKQLDSIGAPTLGVVANGVSTRSSYGEQYTYDAYTSNGAPTTKVANP